jgi:hypothetical protein
MIELKKPIRIKGKLVIPYYIKDGDVMCFDKFGQPLCLSEKDFIKNEVSVSEKVQVVIPIEKPEKVIEKKEEKPEEKKVEEKPKKEEKTENKSTYINNDEYI